MTPTLTQLEHQLHELQATWAYAFAMGHGCTIGTHPETQKILQRAEHLYAQIQEHK